MERYLILRLEAPLMAFGSVMIDTYGVIRDFPAASMLTGLIGNALGWQRWDRKLLQSLQGRLIFAARIDREPEFLQDIQNARLHQKDEGWTTSGYPEGRETSPSYKGIDADTPQRGKYLLQRRFRDYHADALITVTIRVSPAETFPTLDDIAAAFDRPVRPLFLGRKPCLPARPLLDPEPERWVDANTVYDAVCTAAISEPGTVRAQWPTTDGPVGDRQIALSDERSWLTGVHSGTRLVNEGWIDVIATEGQAR